MARAQGRVVAVGIVRMDLERMPFFRGELDFVFSRAYGPGSYDPAYESGRVDYPYGYVRWTERRNLEEFLRLVRSGEIQVEPLIDREYPAEEAQAAFDALRAGTARNVASLLAFAPSPRPEPPVIAVLELESTGSRHIAEMSKLMEGEDRFVFDSDPARLVEKAAAKLTEKKKDETKPDQTKPEVTPEAKPEPAATAPGT